MTTKKTTKKKVTKTVLQSSKIIEEISNISNVIPFLESLINNRNISSQEDRKHLDPLLTLLKRRAINRAIVLSTIMISDED